MRKVCVGIVIVALFLATLSNAQNVAAVLEVPPLEEEMNPLFRRNVAFDLESPVSFTPYQATYPPLVVSDPEYKIPRGTPYFRSFFKENEAALKFEVRKAWITYKFVNLNHRPVGQTKATVRGNSVDFTNVFSGIDVRYTVESDYVLEEIILHTPQEITELVQHVVFDGVTPVEKEGGIYFWNGERFLFGIPPPVMYELQNPDVTCTGLHYELDVSNNTYYLRKVIDEEGLKWLMDPNRKYPVVIDATTESFEDPWENSGLSPYGQYFENLSEYVSPTTGSLTVTQTDFFLPGKGLDLAITRVYTTPAIFSTECQTACGGDGFNPPEFEDAPYGFECPPVDVGNGWQLNFPWVGPDYIHLLNGTMYKKRSSNHIGDHFTFEDDILTTTDGTEYQFRSDGKLLSTTDVDGNAIIFGYSNGKLITITDTLGRVVNLSYNSYDQLTQISYGDYTVTYSYMYGALTSVTDPLGRVTSYNYDTYKNAWLITRSTYPTGGYTDYNYSYFAQEGGCYSETGPVETEFRKYHITNQAVYSSGLVRNTVYSYQGDFDGITGTTVTFKNGQNITKSVNELSINTFTLITQSIMKNASGTQLQRTDYSYSGRKEQIQSDVYMGTSYAYTEKTLYDSWGNVIYQENGEGEKTYYSYANTDHERVFRDFDGNIPCSTSQFFDCSVQSNIHDALVGILRIMDNQYLAETYYDYDVNSKIIEARQIFQSFSPNRSEYSDTFDETVQTSFTINVPGFDDYATLKVVGLPTEHIVTKTETHSKELPVNWMNEGYWDGDTFYARYFTGENPPDEGWEPIGPFVHYPGTAGYQSYTTWVEGNFQYVETTYEEPEDFYPEQVEYNLNGDSWKVITPNLGSGHAFYAIPSEEFVVGDNTLNFRESNSRTTKFDWYLFLPCSSSVIEDVSYGFTYDAYGNPASTTDPLNNTIYYGYDSQYHTYLTSITDALDHTSTSTYDLTYGLLTSITDAKGYTISFEYDTLRRVTKRINTDLSENHIVYDDQNNKATVFDELDHYKIKYYDGIGRLTKTEWYLTQNVKLTENYTYNYLNRLKTLTNFGGYTYSYEYDLLGRLTKIFNPDSTCKEIQYDDVSNLIAFIDENQHKNENHYDWVGRLLWVKEYTDSVNYYVTQYTYNSFGNLTSVTDAKGNTTSCAFDSMYGPTQITYPDDTTETFTYNNVGNLLQHTSSNGTTTFTYDAIHQVIQVQHPDQTTVSFEYDANGNRTLMTDAAGTTSYTYDSRNRLLSETRIIEGVPYTVSYQWNVADLLTSTTYPDQMVVSHEYDALNRLTSIPGYAQFSYNTESLLSSVAFSNNVTTTFQYDDRCRPTNLAATKDSTDLLTMNYQYDSSGNITQMDYNRRLPDQTWVQSTETFTYDWLDRLTSSQGEYGELTYSYDPVGNRLTQSDLTYVYNNMNELLSVDSGQSPSGLWWDSSYQYRREITFGTNHDTIPQGYTCTFAMDTTVASLTSGDDIRIVWQTETEMTELDRVGDMWNSEYTNISFAVQSEIPENAERSTGKYYVYYGNEQAGSPPENPQNVYIFFDDFNRPDSAVVGNSWVEDELSSSTLSLYSGQLKIYESKKRYSHVEQTISEDTMEVTCKIKPSSMSGLDWSPSLDIFWNDSNGGNHIQILTLDSGGLQCKVVSDGTADTTSISGTVSVNQYNWVRIRFTSDTIYFDYGGTGDTPLWENKLTKARPAQLSGSFSKIILGKGIEEGSYTNPDLDNSSSIPGTKSNQYIDDITVKRYISDPPEPTLQQVEMYEGGESGDYTFTYDEMGNTLTKSNGTNTWSYTYDKRNQLTQVDLNQQTIAQYTYDGDGRRIKKTEWIESLQQYQDIAYIYSGINVIYEKNITTGQSASYIYGPTGRVAKNIDELTDYYHTDHLGSTRLITDESGSIVTEVKYEPFGDSTLTGKEDNHLYTGKEKDSTGLYYYGARYYDPQIGRFISRDPRFGRLGNPQTLNRYVYVLNNPLKYRDSTGHGENMGYLYDLDERDPIPIDWGAMKEEIKSFLENIKTRWDNLSFAKKFALVAGFIAILIGLYFVAPHLAILISASSLKAAIFSKSFVAVVGAVLSVLLYIVAIYETLIKEITFTNHFKADPFGTGPIEITETIHCHNNGKRAKVVWTTEDETDVRVEYYDIDGNLVWGSKWVDGTYYEWVLNDSDDPSQGGYWEEKDPPEEDSDDS